MLPIVRSVQVTQQRCAQENNYKTKKWLTGTGLLMEGVSTSMFVLLSATINEWAQPGFCEFQNCFREFRE